MTQAAQDIDLRWRRAGGGQSFALPERNEAIFVRLGDQDGLLAERNLLQTVEMIVDKRLGEKQRKLIVGHVGNGGERANQNHGAVVMRLAMSMATPPPSDCPIRMMRPGAIF